MSTKRSIAVITGSRAEYGLLSHVMRALKSRSDVKLCVIATGSHLEQRFGMTVSEIESDGYSVDARVPMDLAGDTALDAVDAMGRVMPGIAHALLAIRPEIVVVLGDRFEILAAVTAASMLGIPIAHLHGGELTEGAIDDNLRHAITKLSHVHFAALPRYGARLVQMGEKPERIFVEGALAVDAVANAPTIPRPDLAEALGIKLRTPLLLVTYHPVTMDGEAGGDGIAPVIAALEQFPDASIVMTGANMDPANATITTQLGAFASANKDRVILKTSLGQKLYLAVMREADVVVGNSSSGVLEAPIVGVPTVNIGTRQTGRETPPSVINCAASATAIEAAIRKALSPEHRSMSRAGFAFGTPGVARRIAERLAHVPLDGLLRKGFHDLPHA